LLLVFLAVGAILRLSDLGTAPPGMHVDAAANAWTTSCLLARGTDWHGDPWPVFYSRGFGENQSTLYYYLLLPFQAALGMSPATTALPSSFAGIALIALAYAVVRRLFDDATGLVAAALVAVTPAFLLFGRSGHESGVAPFLVLLPLFLALAAGLPPSREERTRPALAFLAGLTAGLACYGYYAVRIFLPALAIGLLAVSWRRTSELAARPDGRRAIGALAAGFLPPFLPLVWKHAVDPEIAKRGTEFLLWQPGEPTTTIAGRVLARYASHFSPDFLFRTGDAFPLHVLPGSGPLRWAWLPFLLIGAVVVARSWRRSNAARAMAVWVLLWPVSDAFTRHPGPNLLRSTPGLVSLVILAAIGIVALWRAVAGSSALRRRVAAAGLATLLLVDAGLGVRGFFAGFTTRADLYRLFNADVMEVAAWMKPRLASYDAVVFSALDSAALSQPFVLLLVGWDYDPARWFAEEREIERRPDTDRVRAFGKTVFLFDSSDLARLAVYERNGVPDRVAIVARPGEWKRGTPSFVARAPDGTPSLVVHEVLF